MRPVQCNILNGDNIQVISKPQSFLKYDENHIIIGLVEDEELNDCIDGVWRLKPEHYDLYDEYAYGVADGVFDDSGDVKWNITSINFPNATSIGNNAFTDCSTLISITLPYVSNIGDKAFKQTSIRELYLPKVSIIGDYAFQNCCELKSINLPLATEVGNYSFGVNGSGYVSSLTSIYAPNLITIGERAFNNSDYLVTVSLPNAKSIGYAAFKDCDRLTSVDLPNATYVGNDCFWGCEVLTNFNLPNVQGIGNQAFQRCGRYKSTNFLLKLPNAIRIEKFAFSMVGADPSRYKDTLVEIHLDSLTKSYVLSKAFITTNDQFDQAWDMPKRTIVQCIDDDEGSLTKGNLIKFKIQG